MKIDKGLDGRGIYRAIYTSLWDDLDFRKLSPAEKLVFLNLRTSPLTNMPVIYQYYVEAIERHTGLDRDHILKALDTLSDSHWIAIEEGIVWVIKGLKFDPNIVLTNEKHLVAIKNIILGLPKLQIVRDFIDFYKIKIPYPIPSRIAYNIPHAIQDPDPDPEEEKEKEEESEEKPKVKPLSLSKGKRKPKTNWIDPLAMTPEEKAQRVSFCESEKERQLREAKERGLI